MKSIILDYVHLVFQCAVSCECCNILHWLGWCVMCDVRIDNEYQSHTRTRTSRVQSRSPSYTYRVQAGWENYSHVFPWQMMEWGAGWGWRPRTGGSPCRWRWTLSQYTMTAGRMTAASHHPQGSEEWGVRGEIIRWYLNISGPPAPPSQWALGQTSRWCPDRPQSLPRLVQISWWVFSVIFCTFLHFRT